MIREHRVIAIFRRIVAAQSVAAGGGGIIFQRIIALGGHRGGHQLPFLPEVVCREHQVLNVVICVVIASQVAKITRIERIIAAQAVAPVDVVDPAAGAAKEHDIAVGKVDIKVIAVKAFTRPDRRVLKRSGEVGEVSHLDVQLAHVQMMAVVILYPRVRVGRTIGQHRFEACPRPVAEGHLLAKA